MSHDDDDRGGGARLPDPPVSCRPTDSRRYIAAIRASSTPTATRCRPRRRSTPCATTSPFPDDPSIGERRALYADIFTRLEQAGVARDDLQLAWDFTTASREEQHRRPARDARRRRLAAVGDDGPYTLTLVDAEHP